MRVLTVCHYHPNIKPSGSGWSAQMISNELRRSHGAETFFLGGRPPSEGGIAPITIYGHGDENDFLIGLPEKKFNRTHLDMAVLFEMFEDFVDHISPDIVHFHSVHTMGLELLAKLPTNQKRKVKKVFTLHNYVPICMNNGWMIKTDDHSLCVEPHIDECSKCFPNISKKEIEIHSRLARELVTSVDALITPSHFSRGRYVNWGILSDKIHVISNGQKRRSQLPRRDDYQLGQLKLGYLGQIGIHKGLHVLLTALLMLPNELRSSGRITLDIFGSNLNGDLVKKMPDYFTSVIPRSYTERIHDYFRLLDGVVKFHGSYDREELPHILGSVDWLVLPSIQWENQPLTIQEAHSYGRPVICSGIGGMAEMVGHQKNGLHFEVGNPKDLLEKIMYAYENPEIWDQYRKNLTPPETIEVVASEHYALYQKILGG